MATIRKKGKKWQIAILKKDGFLPVYKSGFYTKQEAKDWAANEEARRQQANYSPEQASQKHTLATTIDRYVELILPSKPKSAKDTLRHLTWWKEKIRGYALARVSPELIAQYRKELSEGLNPKGTKRSSATVNRYMASLSTVFTYAVKECGWIQTNPMLRVYKLKEARGRDRILSKDECNQLLASCAKSRNKLLLPINVPQSIFAKFKNDIKVYPKALKKSLIGEHLWSVEFSYLNAQKLAARECIYGTVGCMTRIVSELTQVLFALNEVYFASEKEALKVIESFSLKPKEYAIQINDILSYPG